MNSFKYQNRRLDISSYSKSYKEQNKLMDKLNKKIEFVEGKHQSMLVFQQTLKYMLDRDMKSVTK